MLDLQPRAGAPPGLVAGIEPLGDDPLEALGARRLEQSRAVAGMAAGTRHAGPAELERLEALAPLRVGALDQRVPVEVEQIEDRVDDRGLADSRRTALAR